jgi:hypothetical protein
VVALGDETGIAGPASVLKLKAAVDPQQTLLAVGHGNI